MSPRSLGAFLGLVTAWLFTITAVPARAARPRIAIIALSMGAVTADVRVKMNAAIVGGLMASGAEVADSTATGRAMAERGMRACDNATCLIEIGKATGAAYVMRGSMEMIGRSYVIRLEMIDASTATVIDTREDRCEICTENEAYETASVSASALKAQVFRRRVAEPRASATAPASAAAPLVTPVRPNSGLDPARGRGEPMLIDTPPPREEAPKPAERPVLSHPMAWSAGSFSLVAIAAGVTLIAIDGRGCSSNPGPLCTANETMAGGLTLSAVGLLAAAASVMAYSGRF